MRKVIKAFIGVVDGVEVKFRPKDDVTEAQIKEMGLDNKPDLIEGKPNGSKAKKTGAAKRKV
jgi:hypothetical protein